VEEVAIASETGKVMAADIGVSATTVLVPVFYGLSQAVNIETEKKITAVRARKLLADAPGCRLVDNPEKGHYRCRARLRDRIWSMWTGREDLSMEEGSTSGWR